MKLKTKLKTKTKMNLKMETKMNLKMILKFKKVNGIMNTVKLNCRCNKKSIAITFQLWYNVIKLNEKEMLGMKTMLLPTTINVDEAMSIEEAMYILQSNGVAFEVAGETVDGMYKAENGEIVEEQLVPIKASITAQHLAVLFNQECILESDDATAQLVAQDGSKWADFKNKVEYSFDNVKQAIDTQRQLALQFGGASRIGNTVWAWS